ncbi:hypothetical protein HGRIS_011434 [Hohenbuehelia grisea]|uniref:Hydrophobin n=1 Tax=Hohenbuehelia grisea TaxID=104357 RepID=A0ABR3JX87_9AGAR
MFFNMISALYFVLFALAATASAGGYGEKPEPVPVSQSFTHNEGPSSCNTGRIQCCSNVMEAKKLGKNPRASSLLRRAGILDLLNLGGLAGISCSDRGLLNLGSNSCNSQPVCCSNNSFNGLIALGCTPINISIL